MVAVYCGLAAALAAGCASHHGAEGDGGGRDAIVDAGGHLDATVGSDTSDAIDTSPASDAALDMVSIDSGPADLPSDQPATGDAATDRGSDVPDVAAGPADAAPDVIDANAPDVQRAICAGLGKVEDPLGCTGVNICDGAGTCVSRFTVFPITRLVPSNNPFVEQIAPGPDGNLWFNDVEAIGRMTPTGDSKEFALPGDVLGLTAGPDGNIWFSDETNRVFGHITIDGMQREFPRVAGRPGSPSGIVTGPDGNLWLADLDAIEMITPTGVLTTFLLPVQTSYATWITVGSDGNLWFTEQVGKIGRITTAGVITEFPIPETPTTTSPSLAFGIAAGPDGNLWFAEPEPSKIGRITTAGTVTEYPTPTANSRPSSITAGPDGNLWFTEYFANRIGRITPAGVITEFIIPTANSTASGITAGPDGAVWFTEMEGSANGPPSHAWIVRVQP